MAFVSYLLTATPPGPSDPKADHELVRSPACTSEAIAILMRGRPPYREVRYGYSACKDCGMVFVNPRRIARKTTRASKTKRKASDILFRKRYSTFPKFVGTC